MAADDGSRTRPSRNVPLVFGRTARVRLGSETPISKRPRIAIVSDALVQRGGAERVVETLAEAFPQAPVLTLVYSRKTGPPSLEPRVTGSWLTRVPGAARFHRLYLPLYRYAVESLDTSDFDVIVSSHHTIAKSVLTRADQVHVCYCHTPMRALWERPAAELRTLPKPIRPFAGAYVSHLRAYDATTASRVQHYVANSTTTQRRIATYYRRESELLHPPIDTGFFTPGGETGDYYLVAARAVPYKRLDIAIEAVRRVGRPLVVVGGSRRERGLPHGIDMRGHVSNEELRRLMRGARALLFPQTEDFGMAPLETNACGRPVIAYGSGGALDTVIDGRTGILSAEQSATAFVEAIRRFEAMSFDSTAIREHAERFSRERFIAAMRSVVAGAWERR